LSGSKPPTWSGVTPLFLLVLVTFFKELLVFSTELERFQAADLVRVTPLFNKKLLPAIEISKF